MIVPSAKTVWNFPARPMLELGVDGRLDEIPTGGEGSHEH
jgi:hypothetical protein